MAPVASSTPSARRTCARWAACALHAAGPPCTILVATLAISGIPPFSGFWSKDPIISDSAGEGQLHLYGLTLFTAFLTAFYMFRLFILTFGGQGGFLGLWGGHASIAATPIRTSRRE